MKHARNVKKVLNIIRHRTVYNRPSVGNHVRIFSTRRTRTGSSK